MLHVKEHLELLGFPARDIVTGFTGVVSSVCFDLYGCIQACLTPPVDGTGKRNDSAWFDVTRIELVIGSKRVMEIPPFTYSADDIAAGKHGPAESRPSRC